MINISDISGFSEEQIRTIIASLTKEERATLGEMLEKATPLWQPMPGPQTMAFLSDADEIGFGGAAGGGKTALAVGKAIMQHHKTIIYRTNGTELGGVLEYLRSIILKLGPNRDKYGVIKFKNNYTKKDVSIGFGSFPHLGDETKYQGRDHDFIVFDEASNMMQSQVNFLMGWNRTVIKSQKCQVLMTFNPPTTTDGRWIIDYFAPWLDKSYPNKAETGELRWFSTIDGKDREVENGNKFVVVGGQLVYDFDPNDFRPEQIIKPKSRTFIPSKISDNPYLLGTNYMATLQKLPEPLRSQMLNGDFTAGTEDPWQQVIPTAWVEAAMDRWIRPPQLPEMIGIGVDVARGGKDRTVLARCHKGYWFDQLLCYEKEQSADGPQVAGHCVAAMRDHAPIIIDVLNVGYSPTDFLRSANVQVNAINFGAGATRLHKSGLLKFKNLRTQLWWEFRELLDPVNNNGVMLAPDKDLLRELCAPKYEIRNAEIYVQSREDIVKQIGRSPDLATAVILSATPTPKSNRHIINRYDTDKEQYDIFEGYR